MSPADTLAGHRATVRDALRASAPGQPDGEATPGAAARRTLRRLGEAGALRACLLPEEQRTRRAVPLDFGRFATLVRELVRSTDAGTALSVGLHVAMFTSLLARLGGDAQRHVLDAALHGEVLGALAMTDAGAPGSEPLAMTTRVRASGDRVVLDGHKTYVTNVPGADAVVVFAARDGATGFARISAVLVPADHPGVTCTPRPMAVMRGAAVGDVHLDGVELGGDHVLGRHGRGLQYFVQHIGTERLMGGIWAAALGAACLDAAQRDAARRTIGGQPLWANAAVRQRLAAAAVRVELLDAAVERALARATDAGCVDDHDGAVLKAAAAPTLGEVLDACLQLQGARGLEEGSPLLGHLIDARAFGVAGGTTETMLDLVADRIEERAARTAAEAP